MRLQKKILLTSLCLATFATTNLYATTATEATKLTSQEKYDNKEMLISNLDSLFPYPTKITVGSVSQDKSGSLVATDIMIISNDPKNPNISINKATFAGLKAGQTVKNDFNIKIEGLSVANLATAVANSNVVSSNTDPKDLANNQGLFAIMMNTVGQAIYNLDINYDYSNSTISFALNSTISKKTFIKTNAKLKDIDLSGTSVDMDFLAALMTECMNSKIQNLSFDANFSEVLKEITDKYLGKEYKQDPILDFNGELGKKSGELTLNFDGKLGANNYGKYNIVIDGVDLNDSTINQIIDGTSKALDNAYVKSNTADSKIQLNFQKDFFPEKSPIRQVFSILDTDNINIKINSDRQFKNNKYNTNFDIQADGLASLKGSAEAMVNDKLSLLPYLGVGAQDQKDLYDCNNELCLKNVNVTFANYGLLEKIARLANQDPNTTPQQILGSYGALLQLFAVQQQDKFLQHVLSSFAMFLQNPKNISIHAKANRPVNEMALLNMLANDAKTLKRNNPIKNNGNVDLSKSPDVKLINNIQNLFKISFDVNQN
ncbi:hypothetical protein IBE48_06820 [Francisella philomiragia]|uniref:Uncharacterized protein n=1 Tax=Francisella philomiragia TaxID=28110 RepID=A0AAW3D9P7_9GAMM|nr:hypothetical protein [Francisella philomiragia]KFJ42190.1 hypothetical protein DR78_364 [Francisella philomiragia]MBK2255150.1 hypothetical protein [Francisella philomiragia]MBK2273473.1 hypothetical protein [Francisella philomiragia]MBK2277448.1 hypothetical protein [Francisella philomiragia]MBK2281377.1 hypothetical protein [Francisella philomiragia]